LKLLAKTFEGLEDVLAEEVGDLGGTNIQKLTRAVSFEGTEETMYACNYMLRTGLRVLEIKKEFEAHDAEDLYYKIYRLPWDQLIKVTDTFAVDAVVSGEHFTHSKFTALKTKDAIVDKVRKVKGERPNVNIYTPTYRINLHVRNKTVTLSFDTSGESLHMRGYRITSVDAPLNETMAAGLVLLSKWDKSSPLLDPMCGSGTILIEADRIARNIPPQQSDRAFGFKKWRKFDSDLWDSVVSKYDSFKLEDGPLIKGGDKNLRALKVSQQNIESAGPSAIAVEKADFFKSSCEEPVTVITNPPYDNRLREADIEKYYKSIGDQLKQQYVGSTAWIFSGNIDALKSVGLRPSQKYHLMNGGLEAKFYKFELYDGTKK